MTYLLSFLFCGFVCAISQYFLEKTKLTPGHINTSLVIVGCILSGFKIYDKIIDTFHAGASVPIINFGHLLVTGATAGDINLTAYDKKIEITGAYVHANNINIGNETNTLKLDFYRRDLIKATSSLEMVSSMAQIAAMKETRAPAPALFSLERNSRIMS